MIDRYCSDCGKHVNARTEPVSIPESTHSMMRLFCPECGTELGAVYDEELRIEKTFPVSRG